MAMTATGPFDAQSPQGALSRLLGENEVLRSENSLLRTLVDQLKAGLAQSTERIEGLAFQLHRFERRAFLRSCERMVEGQADLFHEDAQPQSDVVAAAATAADAVPGSLVASEPAADAQQPAVEASTTPSSAEQNGRRTRHPGRIPLPPHLERKVTILDLPEDQRRLPDGTVLVEVDRVASERLTITTQFHVERIIRIIYGCPWKHDAVHRAIAALPPTIIDGGKVHDDLLVHVLVSKFAHHLPLYRLEEIAGAQGVDLPRSSLADWVQAAAGFLKPVAEALKAEALAAQVLHVDDTPVRQLDPGAGKCLTARFWTYRHADGVWFDYTEDRRGEHPANVLADYDGLLVADAYGGFDRIFKQGKALEIACWAHARRKFFEAFDAGDPRADQALARIRSLYKIERDIAELTPEQRQQRRKRDSLPILERIKTLVDLWLTTCRPGEPLAKACVYARNQWDALRRFIDDGRAPIDNNPAENALRPIAIGRKNWLFAGSENGGQAAAIAYSLIHSARIHRLDPADYLRRIIVRLHAKTAPELLTPAKLIAANGPGNEPRRD